MVVHELHRAASVGDVDLLERLIAEGAVVDEVDECGWTPLMLAAPIPKAIKILLENGANPNYQSPEGETVLMAAARLGCAQSISILIEAGADVGATDDIGNNALMEAASAGNVATIEALIAAGADPNAETHTGSTALFGAAREGEHEAIRALLRAGADAHHRIRRGPLLGRTAFEIALDKDHVLTASLLAPGDDAHLEREE